MRIYLIIFLSIVLSLSLNAQQQVSFGKYSDEELNMTSVPFDPGAKAVILFEDGQLEYKSKRYITSVHRRIKIFDQSESERGVIRIPFNPETEKVTNIEGVTTTILRGVPLVSKLREDQIVEKKISENLSEVVIYMPQVKKGSIIEYKYKIRTKSLFKPADWNFQHDIPTIYSAYRQSLTLPEDFDFLVSFQGVRTLQEDIYQGLVRKDDEIMQMSADAGEGSARPQGYSWWKMEDLVSIDAEDPYLLSDIDYIEKVVFRNPGNQSNLKSWDNFFKDYMSRDQVITLINGNEGELDQLKNGLNLDGLEDKAKLATIQQAVANAYQWSGARSIYPSGKMNSADVNLRLYAATKSLFPSARLVMLSTPENGTIYRGYPLKKPFDHLVVKVNLDSTDYFLDATDRNLPYDVLPYYSNDRPGLVMQKKTEWTDVSSRHNWQNVIYKQISFEEQDLNKQFSIKWDERNSVSYRKKLKKGDKNFVKKAFLIPDSRSVESIKTNADQEVKGPLTTSFSYKLENYLKDQEKIYVNAIEYRELLEDKMTSPTRFYPIQFKSLPAVQVTCVIDIPEDYEVEKLPDSKVIALPENYGKFSYNAVSLNGKVNLSVRLEISKNVIPANMYEALQEFYNTVGEKCEEPVILVKKN